MKKHKGLFLSFLSLILIVALLGACSNSADNNAGGSNDAVNNNNTTEEGSDEISGEIEVWGWNIAAEAMEDSAEEFMEEHPDTEINIKQIAPDDLYDRMTVGMQSGGSGLPDVSLIATGQLHSFSKSFPDQFTNMTELGFDEHLDKFADFKHDAVKNDDGEIIAMPWDMGPAGVFYRVDTFEEAGVNPEDIETWDDYIEAGITIKEETGKDLFPYDINDSNVHELMMNQLGASYVTEDGEVNLNSEESLKAMEVIQKMADNDLLATVNDGDSKIASFANDKVASVPTAVWYSGTIQDQAPDQEGEWDAFKLPAFEEGGVRAANNGGTEIMIPSATENLDLAYAFAEYFATSVDAQMYGMKEFGLFPSLVETYDDPYFEENVPYFNDSPIYDMFAEVADNVQPSVYGKGFERAQDIIQDTQTSIILEDADLSEAMDKAADRLANETNTERADK